MSRVAGFALNLEQTAGRRPLIVQGLSLPPGFLSETGSKCLEAAVKPATEWPAAHLPAANLPKTGEPLSRPAAALIVQSFALPGQEPAPFGLTCLTKARFP